MGLLAVLTVAAMGFAGSVAQIVVLREFLVLFSGNELSAGLILACWLLWTGTGSGLGGRISRATHYASRFLPVLLIMLSLSLPATLLWIRASRIIWSISAGESLPLPLMAGVAIFSTFPFCTTSGLLFCLAWTACGEGPSGQALPPIVVYLAESVGAALGGLLYYFLFLPRLPALYSALIVALILLAIAGFLLFRMHGPISRSWKPILIWAACLIPVVLAFACCNRIDRASREWQWGPKLVAVRDTPFQNLAFLKSENQYSLFGNGLWMYSLPDPETAEYAVHLALLEHRDPRRVLLIGGAFSGLVAETLKHPGIISVDCVESDPAIGRLSKDILPDSLTQETYDDRVHLYHTDAGTFVRIADKSYDVVLLNLGDPLNAELNRFYTLEFFRRVERLLNRGGIFSLGVSSSPDIVGATQARFLRSIHCTLKRIFTGVLVFPGATARFVAAREAESLIADPAELIDRIAQRKLQLQFVREYYLYDYMNPVRIAYLSSILTESKDGAVVNRDFRPTCYFNSLIVWTEQITPALADILTGMQTIPRFWLWIWVTASTLFVSLIPWIWKNGVRAAVSVCVAVVGGAQMALEMVLLLSFQILRGFLYSELALIVSSFMAGMALGAAISAYVSGRIKRPTAYLQLVQIIFSMYLFGVMGLLLLLKESIGVEVGGALSGVLIFALLALVAGSLGGLHFSLGTKCLSSSGIGLRNAGPCLYGVDLAGSAVGVLVASFLLQPAFGLPTTTCALAVIVFGSSFALLKIR